MPCRLLMRWVRPPARSKTRQPQPHNFCLNPLHVPPDQREGQRVQPELDRTEEWIPCPPGRSHGRTALRRLKGLNAVFVNRSVPGGACAEVSALWGRSGGDRDGAADCEAELSIGAALV